MDSAFSLAHKSKGFVEEWQEQEELPQALLAILPGDPLAQVQVARVIAANALSSRAARVESEAGKLRLKLIEKEGLVSRMRAHIAELEHSLSETMNRLSEALDEQAKLTADKNVLLSSVKKLSRDVAKLEAFKKTLIQSLEEEDDGSSASVQVDGSFKSPGNQMSASKSSLASNKSLNGSKEITQRSLLLTPPQLTHLTPSNSPGRCSTVGGSPNKQLKSSSPRFQSTCVSPKRFSRGESRLPRSVSQPVSQHTTAPNSPPYGGSLSGRCARTDGKEFFRQARSRLTYEQFSAFLANIKELNSQRQTKEETLRKADEIFGPANKDLHNAFHGLLSRHAPNSGKEVNHMTWKRV